MYLRVGALPHDIYNHTTTGATSVGVQSEVHLFAAIWNCCSVERFSAWPSAVASPGASPAPLPAPPCAAGLPASAARSSGVSTSTWLTARARTTVVLWTCAVPHLSVCQ